MSGRSDIRSALHVRPLTAGTWDDFVAVMGERGGARGCWCMHWRLSMAEWMDNRGEGNRRHMHRLASDGVDGHAPGVVAYRDEEPVGWCSLGPRGGFPRLDRSPVLKPVDDRPVWSIACLFLPRAQRGQGMQRELLLAACDYARQQGAEVVEGYPVEPAPGRRAGADNAMTGIASVFRDAGFTEVARHKADRPIMRLTLTSSRSSSRCSGP